ncbi:hypothetical protein AB1Y20_008723 [Prymnesium parvum]|uniref:Uncharacterized protein n=1 Tax=Prymnesium parvum TaxID=97485 RepID=A0AB34IU37_PRYPA
MPNLRPHSSPAHAPSRAQGEAGLSMSHLSYSPASNASPTRTQQGQANEEGETGAAAARSPVVYCANRTEAGGWGSQGASPSPHDAAAAPSCCTASF